MILDDIIDYKLKELARAVAASPQAAVEAQAASAPAALDFRRALAEGDRVAVVAELKKASPSRGVIRADFDPVAIAMRYADCGAAAVSVLTDERFFGGSLRNLAAVRARLRRMPLLRKDFLIDPYQVYEARAAGADSFLLIVRALDDARLAELLALGRRLGMEALVEAHDAEELDRALAAGAVVVGVNNRDLDTFEVTLETAERLAERVPADRVLVAESGITDRSDVERLAGRGVDAVLVGETLIRSPDPGEALRELVGVERRPAGPRAR